jgi:hypothetical protein
MAWYPEVRSLARKRRWKAQEVNKRKDLTAITARSGLEPARWMIIRVPILRIAQDIVML